MKFYYFSGKFPRIVFLCLLIFSTTNPSFAQEETLFSCALSDDKPTTIAQTDRGAIPIINWVSDYFSQSGYNPEKRCQIVSQKFQQFHKSGTLRYLTGGTVNSQPVICAVSSSGGSCSQNNILFTLQPNADPIELIQQLEDIRTGDSSTPLVQSTLKRSLNMQNFLKTAPVDPNARVIKSPSRSLR